MAPRIKTYRFGKYAPVLVIAGLVAAVPTIYAAVSAANAEVTARALPLPTPADREHMLNQYCAGCHNDKARTAGMSVQGLRATDLGADNAAWENILAKVSRGEMPPKGMKRPAPEEIANFTHWLVGSLDDYAQKHPNPGRAALRRMNRIEYANAVRDLLDFDVDMSGELPADDSGYGFDNIADALTFSPTLMQRYLVVAGRIGRLATGQASTLSGEAIYRTPKDSSRNHTGAPAYNERANDDLPLGSRGGGTMKYYAPFDATYTINVFLNDNTSAETDASKQNQVSTTIKLKAGPHSIGASFAKPFTLPETVDRHFTKLPIATYVVPAPPKPIALSFNVDRRDVQTVAVPSFADGTDYRQSNFPRDVVQITVTGPQDITGPGNTPSRRKIFSCHPQASAASETACARRIFATLASQAYRRKATEADIATLMKVYTKARTQGGFEHAVENGVEAILVSPYFLFISDVGGASRSDTLERVSGRELATRLSFFLWSSLPDAQLLTLAEQGRLQDKAVLAKQVTRMLADPRADALTKNFASQWLYLRNLDYQHPNSDMFPEYNVLLQAAMRTETEMFFNAIVRENRSVLDFLDGNYTFLNQRLAEHYGIPGIYGTAFRKVTLDPAWHRNGLLGKASILTATSYDNRTSIVRRGKWILENILAAPPPAPPPDVPALGEVPPGKQMTVREMTELHRANPVCASCHVRMDPLGFALDNYDAIGAWRDQDAGKPVDASAMLPDGTSFTGPSGLENILMSRKEQFIEAFTERLMTYALSRGVESYDMPAIRNIRRQAARDNYSFKSIVLGIVESVPFQMRGRVLETGAPGKTTLETGAPSKTVLAAERN